MTIQTMIFLYHRFMSVIVLVMVVNVSSRPFHKAVSSVLRNNTKIKTRILTHSFFPSMSNEDNSGEQDIIFPDSLEENDPIPRIESTPKCAGGGTFCEDVDFYPYYQLQDILKRTQTPLEFFGKDDEPKELVNRLGGTDETFICSSVERLIFPKIGKNKNNKWKYIINQGEGYTQGVKVETCTRLNGPCDIIGQLPNGYTTSCKQKYFYRKLLSINENGRPIPDSFQLPSACCCAYKKDLDFLVRFGSPVTPIKRK